jgi:hypothetical protein
MTDVADCIAQPGDPDLDCDLHNITITSIVAVDETREVLARFTGGYGRWVDADTGEMTTGIHDVDGEMGARMPSMPEDLWRAYVAQLEAWRDRGTPLRYTAAPGRVSLLIESPTTFLPWARRPDPLADAPE